MNNIISLERNRPLQYPSNDVSMNWPSFSSCNVSHRRLHLGQDRTIQHSIAKYSETESENNEIPQNLIRLSERQYDYKHQNGKQQFQSNENFWVTKFIVSDLIKLILLALSYILPSFYLDDSKQKSTQSQQINVAIIILILSLQIISIFLKLYSQILKNQLMQINLIQIINLIAYTFCFIMDETLICGFLSIYLFVSNFKIIGKVITLFSFFNYEQLKCIKILCSMYFSLNLFGNMWRIHYYEQNQEDVSYLDGVYHQLLIFTFKIEDSDENKILITLNVTFNIIMVFYILKNLFINLDERFRNQQLLESFRLYLQSKLMGVKSKIILIHYSKLFEVLDEDRTLKQEQKISKVSEYLKWKLVNTELSKFKFLSQSTLNLISENGNFIQSQPFNRLSTEMNGLYVVLTGNVQVEFLGFRINQQIQKVLELNLTEIIDSQNQGRVRLEQISSCEVLYFFIEKQKIIDIFQQSKEKEVYQVIKDDIVFYNDTTKLNFRCYFCDQFHPSFNCSSFNIKRRFNYNQIYQDRDARYSRKVNKKSRSAIFQQITYQGTSNNNVFEQSSDSFEVFSVNSSEQISSVGVDQIAKQASTKYLYKEILQADIISDKLTEPIISSTFLRNLTISPDTLGRRQITNSAQNQGCFQDLDSIFDIDKMQEFQDYKTKFNISNIIQLLNKKRH